MLHDMRIHSIYGHINITTFKSFKKYMNQVSYAWTRTTYTITAADNIIINLFCLLIINQLKYK